MAFIAGEVTRGYAAEAGETQPVRVSARSAFRIEFYATEAAAERAGAQAGANNETYNGGFFDGMRCGRERSFDTTDSDGHQLYAVTRN